MNAISNTRNGACLVVCGAVAVALLISVLGCTPPAAAQPEQVIRYNLTTEPKTLDPTRNSDLMAGYIINHCYEGLLRDSNGKLIPGIAQSWDVSADGKTYTFHLRDAKWSDGKPVTAKDFEYSWKRVLDPEVASTYAYIFYFIKNGEARYNGKATPEDVGVTAKDDKTLVVELENPTSFFPQLTAFMAYMPVRSDIVENDPEKWALSAKTYAGNGPYILKEYGAAGLVMEKNPNYWNVSAVKLPRIESSFINEASTELAAFENGDLNILENFPSAEMPRISKTKGFVAFPQIVTYFYTINTEKKPLDDVRVRKALALAVDRKALVEKVLQGVDIPAINVVAQGLLDSAGKDFSKTSGNFGMDPAGSAKPDEARKLLAGAGYPDGKDFPELTLLYNTSEAHKQHAEAVQEMWRRELGINVKLMNQEWQVFLESRKSGNYDIARGHWWGDYADPMTFLDMFTSDAGTNWPRWKNAEYDKLIAQSMSLSGKERDEAMYKANAIFMNDMPIVPLFYPTDDFVIPENVKGVERTSWSAFYFGNTVIE
ncbi:MAG: peptide ABC transporter substrate-binding protein [Synergistaceae bacterium]|jgi:oligopeptide transport system substrate-binding protein|nr:peptide ABC transporter substrate-binding protein [Synergistaceae bacterium]